MWDQRYSRDNYAYGTKPNDFLMEMSDKLPTGKVLCLAEGEGRNVFFWTENTLSLIEFYSPLMIATEEKLNFMGVGVFFKKTFIDLASILPF